MNKNHSIKEQLDKLVLEREELNKELENNKKRKIELCDLINRSAIFDETIVFLIAQLMSYKEKESYVPFTYKKYSIFLGENIEEEYIGIAPIDNVPNFIKNNDSNLKDFFNSKQGYEIFKKKINIVDQVDKDKIENYYNFYDSENDRSRIVFEFLLDDYNIKNSYPTIISPSMYSFEDFEYVRDYIFYLFELQFKNSGKQLNSDEMHKALNDFLELEELTKDNKCESCVMKRKK